MATNNFPRGSREPTQSQDTASDRFSTGWRKGGGLEPIGQASGSGAGSGTKGPQLRGVEANTADGRASRTPSTAPESSRSAAGSPPLSGDAALVSDLNGYGTAREPISRGGMGGVRDGGVPTETFDD